MSNKQWRNAPEGAQAPSEAKQAEQQARLKQAQEIADEYYNILHSTYGLEPVEQLVKDNGVRSMAAGIAGVMWQIVAVTGAVITTVEAQQFRNIVGPELRLPKSLCQSIEAMDADPDDYIDDPDDLAPQAEENSTPPAKRPRGAKHPLVQLIELAIKAARVFEKVTRGTNPNAFNARTLDQKEGELLQRVLAQPFKV